MLCYRAVRRSALRAALLLPSSSLPPSMAPPVVQSLCSITSKRRALLAYKPPAPQVVARVTERSRRRPARMSRLFVWLIAAAALLIGFFVLEPFFVAPSARSGPESLVGETAPIFPLRDDSGKAVSLEQYRGRVVLMNLWASWCPPCRAEMPDLQRLADRYAGNTIAIVGVNEGESRDRARTFATSLGIHFPIWIDDGERYGRIYAALGLPTTVILDRRGVVVRGFDGALTLVQMQGAVAAAVRTR